MLPMIMGISLLHLFALKMRKGNVTFHSFTPTLWAFWMRKGVKSLNPFFRKHVMTTITNWEFLFLNSTLIAIVSFVYAYLHKRENITNLFGLSCSQYMCAGVVVMITVFTSLAVFQLQETGESRHHILFAKGSFCTLASWVRYIYFQWSIDG